MAIEKLFLISDHFIHSHLRRNRQADPLGRYQKVPCSLLKQFFRPYGVEENIFSNSAIRGVRSWVTISQRMSKSTLS